jgi:hypothetical protein
MSQTKEGIADPGGPAEQTGRKTEVLTDTRLEPKETAFKSALQGLFQQNTAFVLGFGKVRLLPNITKCFGDSEVAAAPMVRLAALTQFF